GVTDSNGAVSMRSLISIADPSYPTSRLLKSPDFVTLGSRTVEPFRTPFVARLDLLGSGPLNGEERVARQLAAVSVLRGLRPDHPGDDDLRLFRLRDAAETTKPCPDRAVRVRRVDRTAAAAALHDQLLPDGDALHRLRHRDRLPLSARGHPPPARL